MKKKEFKPGQKVKATDRRGEVVDGKVAEIVPGPRGVFYRVKHGETEKHYRASQLAAA